jgi:malonate-semialdehyde dehydrogenase (acetylating)/methylmalonate-semialdehyde dehydrogenase
MKTITQPVMRSYQDEIFGPVLQMVRAKTYEEALALPSQHGYGNGVTIFTRSGPLARDFAERVNVGMVGINVPISVPVAYHSFGGWKRSAFGDLNQYGTDSVRFFTKPKIVISRWTEDAAAHVDSSFVMPTMR